MVLPFVCLIVCLSVLPPSVWCDMRVTAGWLWRDSPSPEEDGRDLLLVGQLYVRGGRQEALHVPASHVTTTAREGGEGSERGEADDMGRWCVGLTCRCS